MAEPTRIAPADLLARQLETAPLQRGRQAQQNTKTQPGGDTSFAEILRARQGTATAPADGGLKFSAHAQTRMASRQISLNPAQMDRVNGAVQKAAAKGSRDALVLVDDVAMVVSVANKTVVTVVDRDSLKQNVFTNIDAAVIA